MIVIDSGKLKRKKAKDYGYHNGSTMHIWHDATAVWYAIPLSFQRY